jgi:phosphatidate cytidylyltransferase
MRQRSITAFFFALVMLGGIYGGQTAFLCLLTLIVGGSLWELHGMLLQADDPQRNLRKWSGTLLALLPFLGILLWGNSDANVQRMLVCLLFLSFGGLAVEMFGRSPRPFFSVSLGLLGFVYLCVPFLLLAKIAGADASGSYMPNRVLGLLLLVWTNDVGAYLIGSRWGKHKLFERLSPKKTWEGSIGGGLMALLAAWGLSFVWDDFDQKQWMALSLVAAVGSNVGDLVESMLKRSVGVKDTGTIMPGHGGFLDRFDAFIFCLPFFWLVLWF